MPVIYRVDKFVVPEEARERFWSNVRRTHAVLRDQPGFLDDVLLEKDSGPGRFNAVTLAKWASQDDLGAAGTAVGHAHDAAGFRPAEFFETDLNSHRVRESWGVPVPINPRQPAHSMKWVAPVSPCPPSPSNNGSAPVPDSGRLVAMARDAKRSNWLETRFPGLPSQATTLGQYESEASRLVCVQLLLVMGLLQTPAYTRAVMSATGTPAQQIQPRVDLRQERQKVLEKDDPPQVTAILDEAALRRQMGSRRIMADQLRHLCAYAERSNVELRVIPFDHGGHAAGDGAFTLLEFADAPTYVHFEHTRAGVFLHEPADVRPYVDVVASIEAVALDPAQSAEFVGEVLADYERE